jgi:hypothetical protein
MDDLLAKGYQGFPDDPVCQCYPEGRRDCPKRRSCLTKLGHDIAEAEKCEAEYDAMMAERAKQAEHPKGWLSRCIQYFRLRLRLTG